MGNNMTKGRPRHSSEFSLSVFNQNLTYRLRTFSSPPRPHPCVLDATKDFFCPFFTFSFRSAYPILHQTVRADSATVPESDGPTVPESDPTVRAPAKLTSLLRRHSSILPLSIMASISIPDLNPISARPPDRPIGPSDGRTPRNFRSLDHVTLFGPGVWSRPELIQNGGWMRV